MLLLTVCLFTSLLCNTALANIQSARFLHPRHVVEENASRLHNANHIFNAIHSSMRQWGSSWHHNGMSFFLATIPPATQFYHGTDKSEAISGMQWLAFEPEHAMVFAGRRGPPPGGKPPPGDGGPPPSERHHPPPPSGRQMILKGKDEGRRRGPPGHGSEPGWLHTYSTKHTLSLLYIDGMSGGKTDKGTLDSQDYLLRSNRSQDEPMFGEHERAQDLCDMAQDKWQGKVDGFLRMEAGFEVILCDFKKHLDLVQMSRTQAEKSDTHGPHGTWSWLPAIAARYHGIGGERVTLDYDRFVTAFAYNVDLFLQDRSSGLPRLENVPAASLATIRQGVDKMILKHDTAKHTSQAPSINWQARADMIVQRYSNMLQYWLTLSNITTLQTDVLQILKPFIDFDDRSSNDEVGRCTHHFIPELSPSTTADLSAFPLAYHALTTVSNTICQTLFSIIKASKEPATHSAIQLNTAHSQLSNLVNYLAWSSFADCPEKCALNEICFIPIWPLGAKEDRESGHGRCVNETTINDRRGNGYWR